MTKTSSLLDFLLTTSRRCEPFQMILCDLGVVFLKLDVSSQSQKDDLRERFVPS